MQYKMVVYNSKKELKVLRKCLLVLKQINKSTKKQRANIYDNCIINQLLVEINLIDLHIVWPFQHIL